MTETAPCPACGRKVPTVPSRSGKYVIIKCPCKVVTTIPKPDKKP